MLENLKYLAVFGLLIIDPSPIGATILGPAYPPPGPGPVSFSSSGSSSTGIGRTNFYQNLDPSPYISLWFGYSSLANPIHSTQAGPATQMSAPTYNSTTGILISNSTANLVWNTAFGGQNIATQIEYQFQPYTGTNSGPLASGFLTPDVKSLPGLVGNRPLLVTGTSFQIWFRWETSGGTPLLDYYNSSNSLGGSVSTSGATGFWADVADVPEPSSFALFGLSLAAIAALRYRR